MNAFTERQRDIAAVLLACGDRATVCKRMGITRVNLCAHLSDMRRALGVPNDAAMMAALREMNRHPVEHMLAVCRAQPRRWFTI